MGPPILTINHDNTFMLTDLNRRINPEGHLDIFSDDTRFLSYYAYYLDGHVLKRLTSTTTTYYAVRVYLTNPNFVSRDGFIQEGTLALVISRAVEQGIHEDLDLTNYGLQTARFNLGIALRSDFANIFSGGVPSICASRPD
ncbi:glycogen debranching N-terminal domain-containing protein [Leptothermofonsia sp. ETS-13]|uniref:glycogen debranching N-terminal domain-containing protein n=1 Tax=Leptothermofonsia sp. ETS-13 TaxID=3035696 RepID=UPI003BA22693